MKWNSLKKCSLWIPDTTKIEFEFFNVIKFKKSWSLHILTWWLVTGEFEIIPFRDHNRRGEEWGESERDLNDVTSLKKYFSYFFAHAECSSTTKT